MLPALRRLRRTPGFAAAAIVTLALGIGANTAVFAIVNALVFRAPTVLRLDDVHAVSLVDRVRPDPVKPGTVPPPSRADRYRTFEAFRQFELAPPAPIAAAVAITSARLTVRSTGRAERVQGEAITGSYGSVFTIGAGAGRMLEPPDEIGALPNVVISDRLWRDWFNGDRTIVGRATLTLVTSSYSERSEQPSKQRMVTVVGVAPRGYRGLMGSLGNVDVWLPLSVWRTLEPYERPAAYANVLTGQIFVRAEPATRREAIETAFVRGLNGGIPDSDAKLLAVRATPAVNIVSFDALRSGGLVILSLASLILVAACANVANMLYARGATRASEVAVRVSLGAAPSSIFRLFLAETIVIAGAAAALGLALSVAALRLTGIASGQAFAPRLAMRNPLVSLRADLSIDWHVVLYAMGAGTFAALVVGGATAWRASRVPPLATLASAGAPAGLTPRGRRTRLALVSIQVTAALLLVMGTGLFLWRAIALFERRALYETSSITAARFDLALMGYTPAQGRAFYARLLHDVAQLPGVEAAALTDGLPGYGYVTSGLFQLVPEKTGVPGTLDTSRRVSGSYAGVSEGFLDTLGLPLVSGRPLRPNDRFGGPEVAVICQSAAARLFPGEDPIGRRFMFGSEGVWRTVVGVSADPMRSRSDTTWSCESCVAFVPWDQRYRSEMIVMVKSSSPRGQADALRAAAAAIDPEMAVLEAAPIDDSLLALLRPVRAAATLLASLGLLAVVIAALGVYGVVSFLVSARTREFGIRLALGATPRRVIKMVLDDAIHLMLVGLLPGVLLVSLGSRLLSWRVTDFMPNDVATWIIAPLAIFAAGVVAGYIPARRASRVDPVIALRDH